jgi:hypothetical protein
MTAREIGTLVRQCFVDNEGSYLEATALEIRIQPHVALHPCDAIM